MSEILDEKNLLAPATPDEDISSLESSFTIGQYGVWRVLTPNSSAKLGDYWKGAIAGLGLLRVFWVDVWHVDPILCLGLILAQIWQGVQTSVSLYTSNRLLTAVRVSFTLLYGDHRLTSALDRNLNNERTSQHSLDTYGHSGAYTLHDLQCYDEVDNVSNFAFYFSTRSDRNCLALKSRRN